MIQIGKTITAFTLAAQIIDMMLDAPILEWFFRIASIELISASMVPLSFAYVCVGLLIMRLIDRAMGK